MAVELAISGMPRVVIDAETITIGSDPASNVVLPGDDRIKPRHAVIRRVAGRWLVEAREGDSIQVGNQEPGRLHWLTAGDVIRVVENGPKITFQPPQEKTTAPAAGVTNVPAAIPMAPEPAAALPLPAETIAPAPVYDSLFEPLTEPIPQSPAPRREPPIRKTPSAPSPARKPKPQKPRSHDSHPAVTERPERDETEQYAVAEERPARQTPMLRRGEDGMAGFESSSRTGLGWVTICVAVGVIVVLVAAIIWFGGGAASGSDRQPPLKKGTASRSVAAGLSTYSTPT